MTDAHRPHHPSQRSLAEALLWLVPAVWSSNYLIARAAAPHVPPHLLAFGRWGLVFVVLLAWCGPALWRKRAALRAEAWQLVVLGGLGMWICGAWVYLGGRGTSATNIGLIYAAAPIGIAFASARFLHEPMGRRQCWAIAAALAGVLIVVFRGDPGAVLRLEFTTGDLWIVAATVSWVAYSILLRWWPTSLSPVERLCASSGAGLVWLLPFTVWELVQSPLPSAQGWQLIALAGLLPGLVSYLAYAFMQKELGAARAGLVMYLAPLYSAGLAWWLLGEAPRWYHAVGAVLVLAGLRLSR